MEILNVDNIQPPESTALMAQTTLYTEILNNTVSLLLKH